MNWHAINPVAGNVALVFTLVVVANGAPVIAARLLGPRAGWALDLGHRTADGARLFGPSKTWRGVVAALLCTLSAALLLQYSWHFGLMIGLCAMVGDLLTSFGKRRFGLAPSSAAPGIDQLLESLLPALYAATRLELGVAGILAVVALFTATGMMLSGLLFRLGIRRHPH